MKNNEAVVLAALKDAGFEPLSLPLYSNGKPWPAKQMAKQITKGALSTPAFDHAWKTLKKEGRIRIKEG